MNLTVCPPYDRVMIAQWDNECISLSVLYMAWVQFSVVTQYFKGFLLALWQRGKNGSISFQWHWSRIQWTSRSVAPDALTDTGGLLLPSVF